MPDPYARQQALSSLHPKIRKPVSLVLKQLKSEGLKFEVFEAWRTPQLQERYFAKGRNKDGGIVDRSKVITRAKPWESLHQYGLAVDLVLKEGRRWSWDDRGSNSAKWDRMHEIANAHGLRPLSWEKPHLQLASVDNVSGLLAGNYPDGADIKWRAKLARQIGSWNGEPAAPPLPHHPIERPSIDFSRSRLSGDEAWAQILDKIFELEGGYSSHPSDPGGPTNLGITQATLADWRKKSVSVREVKNLSREEAAAIYRQNYFEKVKAGSMPAGLALHVFNAAVLSGPWRAAIVLQQALNTVGLDVEVDGIVGSLTLAAVDKTQPSNLIKSFQSNYLTYLQNLGHWNEFGKGWSNRMGKVHTFAIELNDSGHMLRDTEQISIERSKHVYLIRGLFGQFFSTGLNTLAEKLERVGYRTSVYAWHQGTDIKKDILRRHKLNSPDQPVLIGHSLGATTALRVTRSLAAHGISVCYLATIDPTVSGQATNAVSADNFRSGDFRDRAISGAAETAMPELSHTEIDKDSSVHRQIITNIQNAFKTELSTEKRSQMTSKDLTRAGGATLEEIPNNQELAKLLEEILTVIAGGNSFRYRGHETGYQERPCALDCNPMTPVNAALGTGALGRFLNGRKTAIGILGLIAVHALPVIFPSAAPILTGFEAIGLDDIASNPDAGTTLMSALFAGLTAWGGLGKMEKWIHKLEVEKNT